MSSGAHGGGAEEDRGVVRSEAEDAVPEEKQAIGDGLAGVPATPSPGDDSSSSDSVGDGAESSESAGSSDSSDSSDSADSSGSADSKKSKQGSFWKELPVLIGVALVLALVIKAFAIQAFYIPSQSMENTLRVGDRVLVNKIVYHTRDIHRGDVVVFNGLDSWDPEVTYSEPSNPITKVLHWIGGAFGVVPGEKDYIKRVIGVPGDRVSCKGNGAPILVNGKALDESSYLYTDPVTHEQNVPSQEPFDTVVPKGRLWVMGDHRGLSADSRAHVGDPGGGSIPENKVVGRAFVVVWPVNHWNTLPIPATFNQPGLASALLGGTPLGLGFVGAVPVALLNRRRRLRRRGLSTLAGFEA